MQRDSAMQRDQCRAAPGSSRARFTGELVRAIEELELRRLNRSSQELADAAWAKLQFDLPVVESAELHGLLQQFSESLVGKAGWPCYSLTAKVLENITAGARRSSGFEPDLPQQQAQVQQLVADSLASSVLRKSGQQVQAQAQQGGATQQQLYQQLAAVLLLQYVAKVLLLPEQDAWQLLATYEPESEEQQGSHDSEPWQQQQQQQQQQQAASVDDVLAALAAVNGAAAAAPAGGSSSAAGAAAAAAAAAAGAAPSATVYELVEAAEQDGDSDEYEALEPAGPAALALPPSQQQQQQQYSWEALRRKLLALADSVHYSVLAHEPLWAQHGADGHLLTLLRALGVHGRADELQPLLHAYVGLLVDRLAAAPTQLPLLAQLWEALGLSGGLRSRPCSTRQQQQQQQLPAEAVLAFSVAASAWQQLPGGSARASLWRLMYEHLLPPLEQCTEQLAYSSGSNGTAAAAGKQHQQMRQCGDSFAHVLLCCHVVELLVLGRPLAVDAAGQLTQRGVTRNLVQLWGQHSSTVAAEPLRRAMLLACCASADTAAWVLAVPQVLAQLQAPLFQLGGAAEAHGALWQLLLSRSCAAKQQQQARGAAAAAAAPANGADSWQCDQLLSLLELQPSSDGDARQLQRLVCVLQLMADAQQAAGRQQLWGKSVQAVLRRLAAAVKASEAAAAADAGGSAATDGSTDAGTAAGSNGGGAAAARAAAARSDSDSDDDAPPGAPRARRAAKGVAADGAALARRQSQQLQAAALRLVKGLLTQGGKTD